MRRVAAFLILLSTLTSLSAGERVSPWGEDFASRVCGYSEGDTVATVPASVESLPSFAFAECESLKEVIFAPGSHLMEIGGNAFLGCRALVRISLPDSVKTLGDGCFRECTSLRELTIPEKVTKLPRFMCEWDEALHDVTLPANLKDIGSHAFAYCYSLENVEIPSCVTHIGSNVFSFCTSLKEIEIPDSVTELESYAFSECKSLIYARLPGNPSMLGELMFSGCRALRMLCQPSAIPPTFDCGSYIFEPEESDLYKQCRLEVPIGSEEAYRRAPGWNLFFKESSH